MLVNIPDKGKTKMINGFDWEIKRHILARPVLKLFNFKLNLPADNDIFSTAFIYIYYPCNPIVLLL